MLQIIFDNITDKRVQGRTHYELNHVLLLIVLAVLSQAKSYRHIEIFIQEHFKRIKKDLKIKWKRAPAHNSIRKILLGVSSEELELSFREHSQKIEKAKGKLKKGSLIKQIAFDGKALCGSVDSSIDKRFIQLLSGFAVEEKIILCHYEIDEKSNEIPALQKLIVELGLTGVLITADALHCQKKLLK
jgi:hypothetical protein